MRKVIMSFLFITILFMQITAAGAGLQAQAQTTEGETAMQQLANQMQPGWNLGNTFDATGGETSWGNPATTKEMIDAIAATGFKSIRIPITWSLRTGAAPDYRINPDAMDRIKEVVNWALEDGLYVIINLHHDTDWISHMDENHDEVLARYKTYWTQIAEAFADFPPALIFESINEPRFSDDWNKDAPRYFELLDELNTESHKIIRSSGGINDTRPLLLPTVACSSEQARMDELYKTMQKFNDPNLIATVHYYGHYHFSVNLGGVTTFNTTVQNDIDKMLARCVKTFTDNGIPVIIGEYGLLAFDLDLNGVEHGEMLKYFDYLTATARERNITLMLWDNGQHFDRRALVWRDKALIDTIIHNVSGRTATVERDTIFLKKQAVVTDVPLKLSLNGNELTGLYQGDKPLSSPSDYFCENDTLTVTSDYLLTLPSQPLGETAALTVTFSDGPDWIIRVKQYDTPVIAATSNTGRELKIPTVFNGDELITMAAYTVKNERASGNAGPDSWTPYKQINRCFKADYANGIINLTRDFMQTLDDGDYLLRFYFLSGEKIEYTLTKDKTSLSGLPVVQEQTPSPTPKPTPEPTPTPTATQRPTPAPTINVTAAPEVTAVEDVNWITRTWRNPGVKIGAGFVALAAVAAGVAARVVSRRNKRK